MQKIKSTIKKGINIGIKYNTERKKILKDNKKQE